MYDDDVLKTSKHHDLRTRIAAITARLIREEIDIDPVWLVAEHVADAVMVEVKKELANEYNKGYCDGHEEGWCEGWDANE